MPISSYTTKEINQPVAFTEQRNGCPRVFGITYGSGTIENVQFLQGKVMHGWNQRHFIFPVDCTVQRKGKGTKFKNCYIIWCFNLFSVGLSFSVKIITWKKGLCAVGYISIGIHAFIHNYRYFHVSYSVVPEFFSQISTVTLLHN